jgi:hemoglobin
MKLNIIAPVADNDSAASDETATTPGAGRNDDLREDELHDVLTAFYDKVALDPLLAPYFAVVDMEAHMPRIVDFWATLVFEAGSYSGNAFKPHLAMPGLTAEHFARWLSTLEQTVDTKATGPRAERMKFLGHRIAYSMQLRLGITPFSSWKDDRAMPTSS